MKRPQLKICGVNDAVFARAAEKLGADYLGLIFAEGSPRQVTPERASAILSGLVGTAKPVGVFTTAPAAEIAALCRDLGIKIVQLHRRASSADVDYLRSRGFTVWTLAGGAAADACLFDSSHGDGETDLRKLSVPVVLAGGISSENLREAVLSGADILDVSGSLESSRGVKSMAKLEAFFRTFDALGVD